MCIRDRYQRRVRDIAADLLRTHGLHTTARHPPANMLSLRLCASRLAPQGARHISFKVSDEHAKILAATVPAVAAAGTDFTKHFYTRMFKAVPCLLDVFNSTNQARGGQPQKLFNSVAETAVSVLENREVDGELLDMIAHKHCGLNVQPGNYDIVAEHILGTIEELLTDDPAVLEAWGGLYGQLAGALQAREEALYCEAEGKPGGWRGLREFEVARRDSLSTTISRITLAPVDGKPVSSFTSGQFTTVWAKPDGWKHGQPRHYTLAVPSDPTKFNEHYAISVKKQGLMSDFLHTTEIGTKVKLSAPYGIFNLAGVEEMWLSDPDAPVVFLSAGVGITPTLAMLESLETSSPITWLHASASGDEHAYRSNVMAIAAENSLLTRKVWYEHPSANDGSPDPLDNLAKFHYQGRMDLSVLEERELHANNPKTNYYFCGPPEWMVIVRDALENKYSIDRSRLHFESF
eukprot:TRINITY_DN8496_c0_g1_i2.p1 TRINITY_DN8496_c0_g1~~TRINITY_DN8496_c0_g1_i2.p1  ORF type:complete len:462 (+),score=137.31 TRINITY_DN8496_c0_g1_i2:127-1512(+)